ncbi:o-succinylbenzoate synthase [Isosphaeraceae bacterium EP7]
MSETIERVGLTHIQIPLKEPFRISGGEVAIKDAILVTIESSGGLGLGESSPMASSFGYSSDTPEGCWDDLVGQIVPSLLGRSVASVEDIASLVAGWDASSRFAVAGAETALHDLLAQSRHTSIAGLLGVSAEQASLGIESGLAVGLYPTVVELLRTIETHLVEGYRRVKIKICPGSDLELVRAVRQHFGELPLMVDANAAYRLDAETMETFRALDDFDLLMIEQPLAARDIAGLTRLQASLVTPICIDETADTLAMTVEAIEQEACRIVNLKLQRVGGYGPAKAIHDYCASKGIACWVGTMPELGVGQAHGIHLASLGNCRYPTDIEPSSRWFVDDFTVPRLELHSPGYLRVPDRSGLGFVLDMMKVKRYQVRHVDYAKQVSS